MKRLLPQLLCCTLLALLSMEFLQSQSALAIGEWETLQAYRQGLYVTESEESIIYTTGKSVFYLDKEDLSISLLTRDDGLAETEVKLLRYHRPSNTLIIVYENSVIDLLRDGKFSTLRQIDNFNFSGGDNSINDLFFGENNVVYIAAGFGVSALDLDNETFLFTTFTSISVEGIALYENFLYAATEEGLYRVPRQGGNINDFNNWQLVQIDPEQPMDYSSTAVNVWKDELYFGVNEDVWRWNDATPQLHYDTEVRNYRLQYLSTGPDNLLAGYRFLSSSDPDRRIAFLTETGLARELVSNCTGETNYAIQEANGRVWLGDGYDGIRYLPSATAEECAMLFYPGPLSDRNYRMEHDGSSLWVAAGTLTANLSPTGRSQGLYRLQEGSWTTFNRSTDDAFAGRDGVSRTFDDLLDIVGIGIDETNNQVWVGSYYEGAVSVERATGATTLYDEENSTLQFAIGEVDGRIRVGNIDVDKNGNAFFSNALAAEGAPVSVRTSDGVWAALGAGCDRNEAFAVAVDDAGLIWALHGIVGGGGITVIDPKGTLLDPSDDECRTITASNSNLLVNEVRSIAVDLDGDVWIGTSQGVMVFECSSSALDPNVCPGKTIPVFDEFDNGGLLLETEDCLSITIDGANRKWVGTGGGAYLLSADGREQIAFFDEDNSPLLDNLVRDIAINPKDGTVFFGTENGIISYRSDATLAGTLNREVLKIFPNPVEPGYDGPIAIEGVARDARIKITDLSGKLVFETNAQGGQVVWNGKDYNGRRVQTGVYLVFASSNGSGGFQNDNPDAAVGKIVFVR